VFKVRPNVSLYGIYSESFQPQNQVLLDQRDPVTGINPSRPALPLLGDGFDLGIKTSLLEGRVQATAAYFSINNSNIVRTISLRDAGNVTILDSYQVQSGEEHVDGFELSVTGQITPSLSVMANYTHLNHEVASDPEDPARVGQPLYGVFDDNVGLLVKYSFNNGALDGLAVGAGYKFVSDGVAQPFLANQIIVFPGYHTYDLFASYRFGRDDDYLLRLNARNLTDELYQVSEHMQGYPRSYQLSLTWSF
jgi:outer membrane receptor protein involved in Fe transport